MVVVDHIGEHEMNLGNFKIGTRLGAGFAAILLLLCTVGVLTLWQASRIYAGTLELGNDWLPSVQAAGIVLGVLVIVAGIIVYNRR